MRISQHLETGGEVETETAEDRTHAASRQRPGLAGCLLLFQPDKCLTLSNGHQRPSVSTLHRGSTAAPQRRLQGGGCSLVYASFNQSQSCRAETFSPSTELLPAPTGRHHLNHQDHQRMIPSPGSAPVLSDAAAARALPMNVRGWHERACGRRK